MSSVEPSPESTPSAATPPVVRVEIGFRQGLLFGFGLMLPLLIAFFIALQVLLHLP
jgi:hypothetical protein